MSSTPPGLRSRAASVATDNLKIIKYSAVSVVSIVVTFIVQFACLHLFELKAGWSAVCASTCGAVPSYYLNRTWVWGKSGRSHLTKEVIPFWIMFFIGLVFSIGASSLADVISKNAGWSMGFRNVFIPAASIFAYAVLWMLKYVLFNKILFASHPEDLDPALDGRSGLPT